VTGFYTYPEHTPISVCAEVRSCRHEATGMQACPLRRSARL
jgi:hypothetical protein